MMGGLSLMFKSVGITGMGIVSALGQGVKDFSIALKEGRSNFVQSACFSDSSFCMVASELFNFSFDEAVNKFKYLPKSLHDSAKLAGRRAPLVIQTSIVAALEAWMHAKLFDRVVPSRRIGIVVAGQNTTCAYQHNTQKIFQGETSYLPPSYALHFMDSDQVGTLSEIFGIQGEGMTIGAASASGNSAIIQGCRLIQLGVVDVCMVVGVLADLSQMELQALSNIGAMGGNKFYSDPQSACRPFDREHEGFILGQASGCLILESAELARAADISVLSEIAGYGVALDGNRLPNPKSEGESYAMQQAISNANLRSTDIDYVNTHGSSSPQGDVAEITAIREVFGDHAAKIFINSTKSLTGHCLWSAGIVEAIATVLQLREEFVHANRNLQNPIDAFCKFVGHEAEKAFIKNALSNSFGFGGINTALILKLSRELI